jgi:hypothetical protein
MIDEPLFDFRGRRGWRLRLAVGAENGVTGLDSSVLGKH